MVAADGQCVVQRVAGNRLRGVAIQQLDADSGVLRRPHIERQVTGLRNDGLGAQQAIFAPRFHGAEAV